MLKQNLVAFSTFLLIHTYVIQPPPWYPVITRLLKYQHNSVLGYKAFYNIPLTKIGGKLLLLAVLIFWKNISGVPFTPSPLSAK